MMHLQISISDKQYLYLRHQATTRGQSVDALVAEWIDAEMAWQETLAADPMRSLIGAIEDDLDVGQIDQIVYAP